jgi:transcriptional regulator with XRE-family HTH domain
MINNFQNILKSLRIDNNLSQQKLAEQIGVTQKAIDFWEKGINEPKASYIIKLAKFFGVTSDYILGIED